MRTPEEGWGSGWSLAEAGATLFGVPRQTCHCICFRAPATTSPSAVNLVPLFAGAVSFPGKGAVLGCIPGEPRSPESLEHNEARVLRILHFFYCKLSKICICM